MNIGDPAGTPTMSDNLTWRRYEDAIKSGYMECFLYTMFKQFYDLPGTNYTMEYMLLMNLLVCLCQTQQRHSTVTARDIPKK